MFNYLLVIFLSFASLQAENFSYLDLLKNSQPEQIQALKEANSLFNWSDDDQFHSLDGGLTKAKVYSFICNEKKYVLRFLITHHTYDKRQNEIRALKIGHQLGIAPECIYSDQNAFLMIMPFAKGNPLKHPTEDQLSKLGAMVRKLHDYSDFYPTRHSLKERISQHYQKAINAGVAYPTGFDEDVKIVFNSSPSRSLVPSHGDLNPSNILVDDSSGDIHIIDWTTATMDDPFFDLSFFCLLNLSSEQEVVFLKAYFGRKPSEKEWEILKEEKAKVCLLTAAIWLRFSETIEEIKQPIEMRIQTLDTMLHSPSLKPMQDYLDEGMVVNLNTAPKSEIKSYALSFYKAYLETKKSLESQSKLQLR